LIVTQGKTDSFVPVPLDSEIKKILNRMEKSAPTILTTKTGATFKKRYFIRCFDDVKVAAGLGDSDLHFHDLRGTFITLLSAVGCTPQQVAVVSGHRLQTVTSIMEKYMARRHVLGDITNSEWTRFAWELAESLQGTNRDFGVANRLQTANHKKKSRMR
jgi:integrase